MFTSWSRVRGRPITHRLRSNRRRLLVSRLEERTAPAQLIVTSAADNSGAVTLRSILATANKNGEADTITFDSAITSITLATGPLTISEGKNLTIDGGGSVTINGAAKFGIFGLTAVGSPTISIANITLEKGNVSNYGNGGAITLTTQQLMMTNVSLLNNTSKASGGAVYLSGSGSVSLDSCRLEGNSAGSLGGAIYLDGNKSGSVTLNSCLLEANISGSLGGGLFAENGKVVINSCTIQNNKSGSFGGGIELERFSSATITNTTVAGNHAEYVGGIDIWRGSATMVNCTVAENTAGNTSGGIFFGAFDSSPQSLVIRNCTIAKNTVGDGYSAYSGGLVTSIDYDANPTVQIDSTIIASNSVVSSYGTNNLDVSYSPYTQGNLAKGSNNLFGAATGLITGTNNLIGTAQSPINAGLLPLGEYGGPTPTMALRYNSIAVDKGSNPLGLMFDQRGQPRESPTGLPDIGAVEGTVAVPFVAKVGTVPYVTTVGGMAYTITVTYEGPNGIDLSSLDGTDIKVSGPVPVGPVNVAGITTTGNQVNVTYQFTPPGGSWDKLDIGTYKVNLVDHEVWDLAQPAQFAPPQSLGTFKMQVTGTYVVDSIGDTVDGNYGPGQVTLREAVQLANVFSTTFDTITFDPIVFSTSKTIVLSSEIKVSTFFTINGPGAGLLTLSGNGNNRIFNADQAGMTASGLKLANGRANAVSGSFDVGRGGAIYGRSINLVDCVLIDNSAQAQGGAIYTWYSLSLTRCSILNNTSLSGGGIYARGTVTLDNSTISGNTASNGGGLRLDEDNELIAHNSTIAKNSASVAGGAIYGYLSAYSSSTIDITLSSTIVAQNVSANSPDFFFTEAVNVAGDNNLMGVADVGNVMLTGANNQTGTLAAPLDPMLGQLSNYGGPTPTHALLPGSPCINAGSNPANLTTDQRGFARTVGAASDIGAYEAQIPRATVQINDSSAQRSIVTILKIALNEPVVFPNGIESAIQLMRNGPGEPTGAVNLSFQQSGNVVTVNFNDPLFASGLAKSLIDGRYTLTLVASKIQGAAGFLDGNGDGIAGDDQVLMFHRLFGDANGDARVDSFDFTAFRTAFGVASTAFDFFADGVVNSNDFAEFRKRFGVMV